MVSPVIRLIWEAKALQVDAGNRVWSARTSEGSLPGVADGIEQHIETDRTTRRAIGSWPLSLRVVEYG